RSARRRRSVRDPRARQGRRARRGRRPGRRARCGRIPGRRSASGGDPSGPDMIARLRTYASFVRFSHSIFALPFALAGALLASRLVPLGWERVLWIIVCMVTARSAAMGFNRLADHAFDARNPRTAGRELPRGAMTRAEAALVVVVIAAAFIAAAAQLGRLPLRPEPVLLAVAIGTWVAGFDVLYACQDLDFDRREGLRSIPVRFGVAKAIAISRALHVVTVAALAAVGIAAGLGPVYAAGLVLV